MLKLEGKQGPGYRDGPVTVSILAVTVTGENLHFELVFSHGALKSKPNDY